MPEVTVKTTFGEKKALLNVEVVNNEMKISLKVDGRVMPVVGTMKPQDFADVVNYLRYGCHALAVKSLINIDKCISCHKVFHTDGAERYCDLMMHRADRVEESKREAYLRNVAALQKKYGTQW